MSRFITTESGVALRNKLLKSIAITIRELGQQDSVDLNTKDMIAFIILSLKKISGSVEDAIRAWEKRDYWLKADRFRLDWEWTQKTSNELQKALLAEDWANTALLISVISVKCKNIKLNSKSNSMKIWTGAYNQLMN
jgi:hypothetical protein